MATKKKRASGPTQSETKRTAKQVLLRLRPDVIAQIDEMRGTMQRSAYVTWLVQLAERTRATPDRSEDR